VGTRIRRARRVAAQRCQPPRCVAAELGSAAGGTYIASRRRRASRFAQSAADHHRHRGAAADAASRVSLGVPLDGADPVAWGERSTGFAFATGEPRPARRGGAVRGSLPAGIAFFAVATRATRPAARHDRRAVRTRRAPGARCCSLSTPRSWLREGTERLVANALLGTADLSAPDAGAPVRAVRSVAARSTSFGAPPTGAT